MSIAKKSETGKGNSFTANSLAGIAAKIDPWVRAAAAKGCGGRLPVRNPCPA